MKHYLVYHNTEKMGKSFREYDHGPSGPGTDDFSIVTRKSTAGLPGNVVWLISGEGKPHRDYRLEHWFIVTDVEDLKSKEFSSRASGSVGVVFSRGIPLNNLPWFPSFKNSQGNFSLGLGPIPVGYVEKFCQLVRAKGYPAPGDPLKRQPMKSQPLKPDQDALDQDKPPPGVPDHVWRKILPRRGQGEFRRQLLAAYGGRCAVTGCDVADALEAAHIVPHGENPDQEVRNGLLLRADIHTLFDLHLLRIDPKSLQVVLAPSIRQSCYREWHGRILRQPEAPENRPNRDRLAFRWKQATART